MTGIPVVIVEARGLPVVPVEANAPPAVVAANGRGIPVVVVEDRGVPLVIAGYDPDPPEPEESPFVPMTIYAGGNMQSGDTGYYETIYGSISNQPLPGYPLLEFATRNSDYTQVAFTGDCLALVSGWVPVIPGVTLGDVIYDWAFDGEFTSATWASTGMMSVTQQYEITWTRF